MPVTRGRASGPMSKNVNIGSRQSDSVKTKRSTKVGKLSNRKTATNTRNVGTYSSATWK